MVWPNIWRLRKLTYLKLEIKLTDLRRNLLKHEFFIPLRTRSGAH